MHKINKQLIGWMLISVASIFFILFPILNSVFQYEFSTHQISFLENLSNVYRVLLFPNDIMSYILDISLIFIGIIVGTIIYNFNNRTRKKVYTPVEIEKLITNGENDSVEFKSSLRYDYRQAKTDKNLEHEILKSIAGFLNGDGGVLIIGVDDYGEILGLDNDYWSLRKQNKDGFEQRLVLLISNAFGKAICSKTHITFCQINKREICIVNIEKSTEPIYLNENNRTVFYLRTGNVTNPLTTRETVQYLKQRVH